MKRLVILVCTVVLITACARLKTETPTPEMTPELQGDTPTPRPTRVWPTDTPYPTHTPLPTATSTRTPRPTATPTLTRTPIPTPTRYATATATATAAAPPSSGVSSGGGSVRPQQRPRAPAPTPYLAVTRSRDPGPPFFITVDANRAVGANAYLVSGWVRNAGTDTYEAVNVVATFNSEDGFRYGPMDVRIPCTLLAPDERCPFIIETSMRRPVSVHLQPEGRPTKRQSIPMALGNVRLTADGLNSVHITGTATNENPFKAKNPVVMAVLLDDSGQMVALGYTYVTVEDIEPGASVPFSLRVESTPYVSYQTYVQAERDWR
jgi:hypothetical protein